MDVQVLKLAVSLFIFRTHVCAEYFDFPYVTKYLFVADPLFVLGGPVILF